MSIITVLLFFVYCYGLGFTVSSFVKNSDNFLERNLMRVGFGLSLLPFLALLLNIIKIPGDWRIILLISIAYPAYFIFRNYNKLDLSGFTKLRITKTNISILVMLLVFIGTFYVYASGSFSYPYLEDEDPWGHSEGVKYYSIEKNAFKDTTKYVRYINPYPPSYDILMGILHQTNDSVYWTLKFFNSLIISLSIVFFYFFVKELSGSRNTALFASFALASIPCFLSHFIWALALTVPLFFAGFYAVERIKHDRKWWILAGLVTVTAFTSSPTHSTYFGLFFALYIFAKIISERKIPFYHALAGFTGLFLSFAFWWLPMIIRYGFSGTLQGLGIISKAGAVTSGGGTGDKIYSFADFFVAQSQNMINNPVGIGVVLSLLVFLALVFVIYKNLDSLKRYYIPLISLFLISGGIMIFALSRTYVGGVWWEGSALNEKVPFFTFLSNQSFLIVVLSVAVFALITLAYLNYKNKEPKESYLILALVWLIFSFYAVNAASFHYKLSPFRAWLLLAIPLSMLAAYGALSLMNFLKRFGVSKAIVLSLIILGIFFTSTQQKIAVNTAQWPPGGFWTSMEELQGYLWLRENIAPETKVFGFVVNGPVIGMDKLICYWCEDIRAFKEKGINQSASEINSFLKSRDYPYLIIDGQFANKYGINETNRVVNDITSSGLFNLAQQTNGFLLFKVY
ncbi:hypothetical protein KY347_02350 [Candidatus Woesearchaeota archaeon]|nr:hypothetical protein [Candidatus Woesearchaeota archaeon]